MNNGYWTMPNYVLRERLLSMQKMKKLIKDHMHSLERSRVLPDVVVVSGHLRKTSSGVRRQDGAKLTNSRPSMIKCYTNTFVLPNQQSTTFMKRNSGKLNSRGDNKVRRNDMSCLYQTILKIELRLVRNCQKDWIMWTVTTATSTRRSEPFVSSRLAVW